MANVERVTVGFIPRAAAALRRLVEKHGWSKADLANRAVLLYDYVDLRLAEGDELLIRSGRTGEVERITLL